LTFGVTNTYTGTTTIEAGTNALSAAGDIASTAKLILSGGTFDVSAKPGYLLTKPLQVTTSSSIIGSLTMGATSEVLFDGTTVPLVGGTITMAGQTLKLTTTASLAAGVDYPLISGYTGNVPMLDATGVSMPEGATASLIVVGGVLKLSIVAATTDTSVTVSMLPTGTATYGTNITVTASVLPLEVPDGSTVNLYAAADLSTVVASWIVSSGQAVFTFEKPAVGTYSYVAKYMGGGAYSNSQSAASSAVTIQPKTITISGIEVDKLFDGTTNVTPRYVATGVLPGEANPVSCVASYADASFGSSKTVTLTWYMPNTNYVLSDNPATVLGTIYENAIWSGGGVNNFWQTPENWANNLVPNSTGVAALFNTDATVSLSTDVNIKKLLFNGNVILNGPGTFTFPQQYTVTGEVSVAVSKTVTFNALIASAFAGIPKKGFGTMILMGNHGFGGKLEVQEGIAEMNQTTAGPLTARDYTMAENATLRFVCAALVSAGTQLTGTRSVTGDGIFEVASGYLRVQSSTAKVSMSMSDKGQIIVRNGAKMDNSNPSTDRYANNRAKLFVEGTGLFGLTDEKANVGSLHGDGEVKAETVSHTFAIMGNTDGVFSGVLSEKDANNKLMLAKWGLGTQTLSGTNSYTGATSIYGGCLTLAGGTNRLSANTPVTVTNAVLNLGLTQQTFNNNPVFRAGSKLAVDVSKSEIGRLTLTNHVDVSSWTVMINNLSDYPKGKKFAVISTGADKTITGVPALADKQAGFLIYNQNNTIYIDYPGMLIFLL
jgi:autotransporter-associated beta strand protein